MRFRFWPSRGDSSRSKAFTLWASGSEQSRSNVWRERYLGDLYHALMQISWSSFLALLVLAFVALNALFALAYELIPGGIRNSRSFADAFFFSVQTIATIGYGHMTPVGLASNALVALEAFIGLLGLALVTGLAYARFARPTSRVMFSNLAVISQHNGTPALMFRMANARENLIVEAQIHVVLLRNETTLEGEFMRRFHDLRMERDRSASFTLSWTAIHRIDAESPLYGATPESLASSRCGVRVSLIGLDETFGQTVHARHYYSYEQILFGYRLQDIMSVESSGSVAVDYSRFHEIIKVDQPAPVQRVRG